MFFRREHQKKLTFSERMECLREAGFTVDSLGNGVRAARGAFALDLVEQDGEIQVLSHAGLLLSGEIARLTDGGFQKFFRAPSGQRKPAAAADLQGLHEFEEDLREALGQESYYNESLGTVSTFYLYDRVADRDKGVPKRAWE